MHTSRSAPWKLHAALCIAALAAGSHCWAGALQVTVTDEHGKPVPRVAVYAQRTDAEAAALSPAAERTAIMDQQNSAFVPHLLIVQSGTSVLFPNNDVVSHHVYSFSEAKTFELGLYKGAAYPPVVLDRPGVVVLGCNIHDGMLGYIVVVDTAHFALTNERGVALLDGVPPGEYALDAWTPRARPGTLPPPLKVEVAAAGSAAATVRIAGKLAPEHDHGSSSLSWDRY